MKKNVYGDTGAMRARGQNIFRKRDVTEQIKDRITFYNIENNL